MKPLLIASLLALAAPAADAGDVKVRFGFGYSKHDGLRIGVGIRKDKHRHHRHYRHDRHNRHHRHHRRIHHHHRRWVPGHYETVVVRHWVPGHYERVYEPVRYGYRRDRCGTRVRYVVRHGYHRKVWVPGRYVERHERVWRPGHYVTVRRHRY